MRSIILFLFLGLGTYLNAQTVTFSTVNDSGMEHKLKNELAPKFKAMTLDNKEVSLTDLKGKIVLLSFWNLSCPACFKEIPELNELVKKYSAKKFLILSFTDNSKKKMMKMMNATSEGYRMKKPVYQNDSINFQIISDAKEIMKLFMDEISYPKLFIVDQKGIITYFFQGYIETYGVPGTVTGNDLIIKEVDRLLNINR